MAVDRKLPNLAPEGYAEIFRWLRETIPALSSNWTDYNASDPGITLLQLFAFIAEGTSYRVDRVPAGAYRNFALLAAGTPEQGLDETLQEAVQDVLMDADGYPLEFAGNVVLRDPSYVELLRALRSSSGRKNPDPADLYTALSGFWRSPYRAITEQDFAALALECSAGVSEAASRAERAIVRKRGESVEVTIVSGANLSYVMSEPSVSDSSNCLASIYDFYDPISDSDYYDKYGDLMDVIGRYLAPRCLIGTSLSVVRPQFDPTRVVATVAALVTKTPTNSDPSIIDTNPASVLRRAWERITALLDPLIGGPSGQGYPYRRPLTSEDIASALQGVDGLDASQPVRVYIERMTGLRVGKASVGQTTVVLRSARDLGFPWLVSLSLQAVTSAYGMMAGASRIGKDTMVAKVGGT
ncbi:hypothetical protein [Sorangium sp. So ce1000]|uniref:hypothetical protein n=1 Tax=Sorangium sp. So ce1000 TaxID=3133325 RepID=UPI003F5F8262